ncbi:hypothetical protein [Actinoplanes sp. NPDC051851]|uniref:hypothetical protein n=1 Tax=Actinoplanes sp. NPDC051851 TaxID=3154753 RepID=UPI00344AA947
MTGLLTEFGKKLADRWLSTLVLPGLLFAVAALGGHLLGWRHALDATALITGLDRIGRALAGHPARIVVAVVAVGLAATAAGLAAQGLAALVHRVYVARGPRCWLLPRRDGSRVAAGPLWLLLRRRRRARAAAAVRRSRPPVRYLPRCATPIGDRFRLIGERVDAQYGLDATLAWPRLWLLLGDPHRTAVQNAYTRYQAATALSGWALLYLALGVAWPPALLAAAVAFVVGYHRAANAAAVLADLVEATIDVQQRALAEIAGVELAHGRITRADGRRINDMLNKRA